MKTKYKFIEFRKEDNNLYYIWNHRYNQYLGELRYNAIKKWEEWEFLPDSYTAFTHQCLEDIIHFIKQLKDLEVRANH